MSAADVRRSLHPPAAALAAVWLVPHVLAGDGVAFLLVLAVAARFAWLGTR